MENKPEIIGLGEIALDWVCEIPHFPSPDEKIDALSRNLFVGGVTANFLTGVARLGGSAGFLGAVGNDEYGTFLLAGLKKNGVDSTFTKVKDNPSPVNFIMVAKDSGEKIIVQSPYMQTTKLDIADIDSTYFENAKVLHTTAIHPDLTRHCIDIAKERGIKVSLDLEKQIAIRGKDAMKDILKNVDILLPQKEGARTITGEQDVKVAAKKLLEWGPKLVVMTLGADGCLITTSEMQEQVQAFKVPVTDTTGAGDAFCAAFLVSHVCKGMPVCEAAQLANAVSAIKIQHLGATSGIPTWEEAIAFQANVGR